MDRAKICTLKKSLMIIKMRAFLNNGEWSFVNRIEKKKIKKEIFDIVSTGVKK